jgi:8-hydroxy-5-deazaflavin:NADPH oxidoreductase
MNIGIIGAGNVGGNLGATFSKAGLSVKFGLKGDKDAKELLARCKNATAGTVEEAVKFAEVVFLAVPGSVALQVARDLAPQLEGKVVVDCNNSLTWKDGPVWAPQAEGSLTAAMQAAVPGAKVVKAFNGFGAEHHDNPEKSGVPAPVFMAGDDAAAKKKVGEIASQAGFRAIDAGPLRNAGVLENVAILWIHLATVGGLGRDIVIDLRGAK